MWGTRKGWMSAAMAQIWGMTAQELCHIILPTQTFPQTDKAVAGNGSSVRILKGFR